MMLAFKAEGAKYNPYRDLVVDHACSHAVGDENPTQEGLYSRHGLMVAPNVRERGPGAC